MSESDKFEFSSNVGIEQTANYLEKIAEGLRKGVLNLTASGRTLRLEPSGTIKLEIEAESKPLKGKGSLQFEISWKAHRLVSCENLMVTAETPQEEDSSPFDSEGEENEEKDSSEKTISFPEQD